MAARPIRADPTPRADAQRNRARLVDAALAAFTEDDAAPLDAVARRAGVGIGTLYRHFPTRESLIEAVYRSELERLCAGAAGLVADHPADVALRRWMASYADFVSTKRGMAEALRAVIESGAVTSSQTRSHLAGAVQVILEAGVAAGTLRDDVRADDVVAGLAGVLLACRTPEQRARAGRLLDLQLDALRPAARTARDAPG